MKFSSPCSCAAKQVIASLSVGPMMKLRQMDSKWKRSLTSQDSKGSAKDPRQRKGISKQTREFRFNEMFIVQHSWEVAGSAKPEKY